MDLIWKGIAEAVQLLARADPEVLEIALLSLQLSGLATLAALVFGVPLGAVLAFKVFPGRRLTVSLINTGMGLPPESVTFTVGFTGRDSLMYPVCPSPLWTVTEETVCWTLTVACPLAEPDLAVMVAEPEATAVTRPELLTCATLDAELCQETDAPDMVWPF